MERETLVRPCRCTMLIVHGFSYMLQNTDIQVSLKLHVCWYRPPEYKVIFEVEATASLFGGFECVCHRCACVWIPQMLICIIQHGHTAPKQTDQQKNTSSNAAEAAVQMGGGGVTKKLNDDRSADLWNNQLCKMCLNASSKSKWYCRCGYLTRAGSFRIESHLPGE